MRSMLAPPHVISLACLGSWLLLVSIQFGMLPFARYAWGFNLWQYLPPWASVVLAVATLALCSSAVRSFIANGFARVQTSVPFQHRRRFAVLALLTVCLLLWLMRERELYGDSQIFMLSTVAGFNFWVQEIGATFLITSMFRLMRTFSLGFQNGLPIVQAVLCACGGLTILFLYLAARYLAPGHAASATLIVVSGGMLRLFAGHLEVYPFLLVGGAAYLWSALLYLNGRCSWVVPSLALGFAVWLHMAALFLIPSLMLLPLIADPSTRYQEAIRRSIGMVSIAALPSVVFLLGAFASGDHINLETAWHHALAILGLSDHPHAWRRWVRGWGDAPSVGTDYVFLSLPHLKYLINSAFVLAPSALPILAGFFIWSRKRFLATPTARFLCSANIPLIIYALTLRPVYGPYDWDLFSITALFLAALSVHLLVMGFAVAVYRQLTVWLAGFSLLFVGIPFLITGIDTARSAGPFVAEPFKSELYIQLLESHGTLPEQLVPWL